MAEAMETTELLVIGAGPGGYAAAFLGADLGLEVTLVDPEPDPGGVCLYRGCIPSKALLHVAKVIEEARAARSWGVGFGEPEIDLDKLRSSKDSVVETLTGGLADLSRTRRVNHVRGAARFVDHRTAEIEGADVNRLRFQYAIVATGSNPVELPGLPFDSDLVWSSREALELSTLPERLLVVGGGYIGLEMATVYAALGSEVTVVEATDGLLPGVDRELVEPLVRRLRRRLAVVHLQTQVSDATEREDGVEVVVEGEHVDQPRQTYDRVLVAVGREPAHAGVGLEHTRVEVGPDGFIAVDAQRQTAEPAIYALGDVAGEPMLAHKAHHEGRAAVEAIVGRRARFEPRAIPAVVYTDPQVAWCGLSESEAREANRDVRVGRFPWSASGRARTMGRADGLTKVVCDAASGRLLGVGVVGANAGELIAEAALAVEMAATAEDLARTIHPHPTLSETLMEACEATFGEATHIAKR